MREGMRREGMRREGMRTVSAGCGVRFTAVLVSVISARGGSAGRLVAGAVSGGDRGLSWQT